MHRNAEEVDDHVRVGVSAARGKPVALADGGARHHAIEMFVVTEADAAAIRAVFTQEGELSAAIELRRRFPGITDNTKARECARSIAGWPPLPIQPLTVTRLRPRYDR
jgi:hypothetical protein